ncbi:MAG: DUF6502 family protein [Pseudomonadota bacterium]
MRSRLQEKLLGLLFKALRPLVHILLEAGIGHREFAEVAKRAYVDVAIKNYGIRGRDTNISRVAVMTGLTRKEVKKIKDSGAGYDFSEVKQIPANTVLNYWYCDEEFLDGSGEPKGLDFAGGPGSFSDLVKRYAGDIPPGALRTELIRTGAVEKRADGMLIPKTKDFRVSQENLVQWSLERPLFGITSNLAHNIFVGRPSKDRQKSWTSRVVEFSGVDLHSVPELRARIKEKAIETTELINSEGMRYEDLGKAEDSQNTSVFFGCFYWEESGG